MDGHRSLIAWQMGSLGEVDTLIALADRIHVLKRETAPELFSQADEVARILYGLRRSKRLAAAR